MLICRPRAAIAFDSRVRSAPAARGDHSREDDARLISMLPPEFAGWHASRNKVEALSQSLRPEAKFKFAKPDLGFPIRRVT